MTTKKTPAKKPAKKPAAKKPAVKKSATKKPAVKKSAAKPAAPKAQAKPATPTPAATAKPAAKPAPKVNGKRVLRAKTPVEKKMKHPTRQGSLALTKRDIELLNGMAKGQSFVAIGKELGYEPGTLRVYAHHLYQKIGVEGQVQAAVWASKYLAATP